MVVWRQNITRSGRDDGSVAGGVGWFTPAPAAHLYENKRGNFLWLDQPEGVTFHASFTLRQRTMPTTAPMIVSKGD
jgi:hypothetical protein